MCQLGINWQANLRERGFFLGGVDCDSRQTEETNSAREAGRCAFRCTVFSLNFNHLLMPSKICLYFNRLTNSGVKPARSPSCSFFSGDAILVSGELCNVTRVLTKTQSYCTCLCAFPLGDGCSLFRWGWVRKSSWATVENAVDQEHSEGFRYIACMASCFDTRSNMTAIFAMGIMHVALLGVS